jgi:hypothetical protein
MRGEGDRRKMRVLMTGSFLENRRPRGVSGARNAGSRFAKAAITMTGCTRLRAADLGLPGRKAGRRSLTACNRLRCPKWRHWLRFPAGASSASRNVDGASLVWFVRHAASAQSSKVSPAHDNAVNGMALFARSAQRMTP